LTGRNPVFEEVEISRKVFFRTNPLKEASINIVSTLSFMNFSPAQDVQSAPLFSDVHFCRRRVRGNIVELDQFYSFFATSLTSGSKLYGRGPGLSLAPPVVMFISASPLVSDSA
jgi:hypothetical protein